MDVSVVIVTYNVEHVISYCLHSVFRALHGKKAEVIIIDNNSLDDTLFVIESEYPKAVLKKNERNVGFASGCHQGAEMASGRILLFLNPDTIIAENYITVLIDEFATNPKVGTVSPLLLDGSGKILQECAREVPSLSSAFLHYVTDSSGHYYHDIPFSGNCDIPVVSGACIAITKDLWNKIGGFDTRYFMYAEDIDLSIQVCRAGYTNRLLIDHPIIHLKGESTRKSGWNYNHYFFKSMSLFATKYSGDLYSGAEVILVRIFVTLLSLARYLGQIIKRIWKPIRDGLTFLIVLGTVQVLWSQLRYNDIHYYDNSSVLVNYSAYVLIWIMGLVLNGAYLSQRSFSTLPMKGFLFGWIGSLLFYAILPEDMRSSRMILLLSGLFIMNGFLVFNFIYSTRSKGLKNKLIGIVINESSKDQKEDFQNHKLFQRAFGYGLRYEIVNQELTSNSHGYDQYVIALSRCQLPKTVSSLDRTKRISYWNEKKGSIIFGHDPESQSLVLDGFSFHNLSKPEYIFQKRIADFILTLVFIPFVFIFNLSSLNASLRNIGDILKGNISLIGYDYKKWRSISPKIKPVLLEIGSLDDNEMEIQEKIKSYSIHYSIFEDLYIAIKNFKRLIKLFGKHI